MHEMGIAMTIVAEVERVLDDFGPHARARSINLQVGRLRAVVPEALEFCFLAASQRSRADGARLIIEQIPVRVRCTRCELEQIVEGLEFFCTACDGPVELLSGKELLLRTIEVEEPDAEPAADPGRSNA